jgi:GNAT superfamily N-acetyltransferase
MDIEQLDLSQRSEILGVLKQAFADNPVLAPGTSLQTTEAMLELMIDSFGGDGKALFYGIRKDGTLICVSFSVDARNEPKGLALIRFFFGLFRILGWTLMRQFIRTFSERPHQTESYLDLTLLGTLPAYHGTGSGRTMLRFLYDLAGEKGYHGIILAVVKGSPAYHFYAKEGFITEKDTPFGDMVLSHMRRDNI